MPKRFPIPLRQAAAVLAAGVLALVAACGGGGGGDAGGSSATPVPTTGTTATPSGWSQGPITGFGSVIVNGVRWDDSAAHVLDDDDVAHGSDALKLGMVVEVEGEHASDGAHASSIRFGSETLGPVSSIDSAASTLVVMGLTVQVNASTVFDTGISNGLAGLAPADVVEVYGLFDAGTATVVATRIEKRTGVSEYRVRGTVSALDTGVKTFQLGTQLVSYASATGVPATLANGVQVKVRVQTAQAGSAWVANRVRLIVRETVADRSEAEVEGVISGWTSATSFSIDGLPVDASAAAFPEGQTGVVLGAHVEVKGAVRNGTLVATRVHLEDDIGDTGESGSGNGGDDHGSHSREFELHGTLSALDTTAQTFALRGLTVSYASGVVFRSGSASLLANGVRVEVKGPLSADGTQVSATSIGFE